MVRYPADLLEFIRGKTTNPLGNFKNMENDHMKSDLSPDSPGAWKRRFILQWKVGSSIAIFSCNRQWGVIYLILKRWMTLIETLSSPRDIGQSVHNNWFNFVVVLDVGRFTLLLPARGSSSVSIAIRRLLFGGSFSRLLHPDQYYKNSKNLKESIILIVLLMSTEQKKTVN